MDRIVYGLKKAWRSQVYRRVERLQSDRLIGTEFYRRFPYAGGVALRDADMRGMVDFSLGIFYNRIPKAANSTVVVSLALPDMESSELPALRKVKGDLLKPSQLSAADLERFAALYKFTFVRNPYTRVLSAFLDKVIRKGLRPGMLAADMKKEPTFPDFCRYLEEDGLYENAHWAPQASLLLIPQDRFDFIGRVESLSEDLQTVFRSVPALAPRQGGMVEFKRNQTKSSQKVQQYYDAKTHDLVARLYAADFAAFEYPPDLPR